MRSMKRAVVSTVIGAAAIGLFVLRDGPNRLGPSAPSSDAFWSSESASTDGALARPSAGGVVYVIGRPSDDVLTPARLDVELAPRHAADWQDVLDLHDRSPIEVLIIDDGSVDLVDWRWVADRSEAGIVIVGINVPLDAIAPRIPNPSLQSFLMEAGDLPAPPIHPGDRVSLLAMRVAGSGDAATFGASDQYVNNPVTLAMGAPGAPFFQSLNVHRGNLDSD